jgi:aspartyl-tRNA(Asn)/glutamyl-tRNA(Gln) amidotransferase subunit C
MALTKDEVRHIAKLARLSLTEEEVEKFTQQFENIFEYLDALSEVNTNEVEPTAQVTGLKNVMMADTVQPSLDRDEVLRISERDKERGMIKVRKSI